MTDLQMLVRQTSNPSILKMQQRLHEEVLVLGKQALEWKATCEGLQLALETERSAANMYAKQVAHWIEKHDALLAQQLSSGPYFHVRQCVECANYNLPLDQEPCASCVHGGNIVDNFKPAAESYNAGDKPPQVGLD